MFPATTRRRLDASNPQLGQLRLAVLGASLFAYLGFITNGGGLLVASAALAAAMYGAGWSIGPRLELRIGYRITALVGAFFIAILWAGFVFRSHPETSSLLFTAGAFAAFHSFTLKGRPELVASLIISAGGAIAAMGGGSVGLLALVGWLVAFAASVTLAHATDLAERLEHSDAAMTQEGAGWWYGLIAKALAIAAIVALLITLIAPLLKVPPVRSPYGLRPGDEQPGDGGGGSGGGGRQSPNESGSPAGGGGSSTPSGPPPSAGPSASIGAPGNGGGSPEGGPGAGGPHAAGGSPGGSDSPTPGPTAGAGGSESTPSPGDSSPGTTPQPAPSTGGGSGESSPGGVRTPSGGGSQGGGTPNPSATGQSGGASGGNAGGGGSGGSSPRPNSTLSPGFSPDLQVPSGKVNNDDTPVLRIESQSGGYFRGGAFETYENGHWAPGTGSKILTGTAVPPTAGDNNSGTRFAARVTVLADQWPVYYAVERPESISASAGVRLAANSVLEMTAAPAPGTHYSVNSSRPDFAQSSQNSTSPPPPGFERYLQLPSSISPRVQELANQITAGKTTRYEKTAAIVNWIRPRIRTSDQVKAPPEGVDPVEYYLFEGEFTGFSNHVASATAILLRAAGVECRVVSGYVANKREGDAFVVRRSDAYDWVEVWFPSGWATVDPGMGLPKPNEKAGLLRWLWLLLLLIPIALIAFFLFRRQRASTRLGAEAEGLLARLERATGYRRELYFTPGEYATALRWKLPPGDADLAARVVEVVSESAYGPNPVEPSRWEQAMVDIETIRAHRPTAQQGDEEATPA